jgi:GTP-binding protein
MFRDELRIFLKAGDGGRGVVSFLREKFVPKGGPDGGDGGRGGDVILVARPGMNTLYHLTHQIHQRAESGDPGAGSNCYGKRGRDLRVEVPVGTIVRDRDTGVVLKDMVRPDEEVVICRGGRGGRGNKSFAGATNQVPRQYEEGQRGEERWVELELKLIADVGLVGLPNAGKSTLLSRVSAARPKIADYPFTTLIPQPGIVSGPGYKSFVMADLPGLIEGAHEGVGLGAQFLKHVDRTRLLVHLVDLAPLAGPRPAEAYRVIRGELERYSPDLALKPEVVVGTKADVPGWEKGLEELKRALRGKKVMRISAVTGVGLKDLVVRILAELGMLGGPQVDSRPLPQVVKPVVSEDMPRPQAIAAGGKPMRPPKVASKKASRRLAAGKRGNVSKKVRRK